MRPPIDLVDVVEALSMALDLIDPRLTDHHRKVALLAVRLAEEMGLPLADRRRLNLAAAIHDLGAFTIEDATAVLRYQYPDGGASRHAEHGYRLLLGFPPLAEVADIVRFHHVPWQYGRGCHHEGAAVPLLSHILHLADRVQVIIERSHYILLQVGRVVATISGDRGRTFHPAVVDAFLRLSRSEAFWLDLTSPWGHDVILPEFHPIHVEGGRDGLLDVARFFARIIDSRSRFTATHSAGVAAVAASIGGLAGLCQEECYQLRLAGLLHDIGKLAIPGEILEKNGPLTDQEFALMRSHTYHTMKVIERIGVFRHLATWAAYHHEGLDGDGYPFRVDATGLLLCARIVQVADVFTALTEARPYRPAMARAEATAILVGNAAARRLDPNLVALVERDYPVIDRARVLAQAGQAGDGIEAPYAPGRTVAT